VNHDNSTGGLLKTRTKLYALAVLLTLVLLALCAYPQAEPSKLLVIREVKHDVSPPLRDLQSPAASGAATTLRVHPVLPTGMILSSRETRDPALQTATLGLVSANLGLNFEGLGQGQYGFAINAAPPDTNGAVGATQYVQWVNSSFAVFDKTTGSLLMGPTLGNSPWAGFGGGCQNNNDGDPIAQYDKIANRWILSQFSVSTTPFLQCVAVSTTSDATGSYNRYAFQLPAFNDYPKMGVWPDAYYFSFNMFNGNTFLGAAACAMNRAAMLAGTAANMVCFQQSNGIGSLLPSDMDGTIQPISGEPDFFINFGTNALNMWKFHVDFTTPANSTFTGPTTLAVSSFTPLCSGGACVSQPGTTQKLDSLADRLMYRLAWRKFPDGHEALVVTHSIASGIRWYEIRNPNGTPIVFQQGTFAPSAGVRWMGSIAMDQAGDIALGYSVSSGTIHPSVFFTGRVPTDANGTLETETAIVNGTGEQNGGLNRWGDYSAMTVDPVDDCTFWYTQEYMKFVGSFNWNTRIANFKFPSCGGTTPVTFNPTSLSFPNQTINTTSSPMPIVLTNNQNNNLTISNIATSAEFALSSQNCGSLPGAIVLPGGNCTIQITFTPTATGLQNGTLTVSDDAPGGQQTAALSGTGVSSGAPQVSLSPTSLTYPVRLVNSTSAAKTVTLTNTGNATLNISNIGISGDFSISAKTCGSTLTAGLSCTVSVKFTPTAAGARTGSLTFTDNAAGNPQSVALKGTGTIVSLSRTSINFGTITVGTTSAPQSVTITNKGNVTLNFTSPAVIKGTNPGDFAIASNNCGSTLLVGANCSISMTFKPTTTGTRKATLNITDDGGGSPQKVSLTGTGQ
jgi:Abnormal spindle-like microcephaly-assoc'd, ASPM-SPD-2-Hydin